MSTIEHGVLRQVWFAPVSNPADKSAFLIRDDAYSEREAAFGRTVRLGEPVDLGPLGSWRQTNWSGGFDQETWRDDAMFELGTADVSERKGAVKLWNGFKEVKGLANKKETYFGVMAAAAVGLGDNNSLVYAERTLIGSPADWKVARYDPGTGTAVNIKSFDSAISAMSLVGAEGGDATGYMLVGTGNGQIWLWNQESGAWNQDSGVPGSGAIGFRTLCPFNNATYYLRGNYLIKRVAGTHTTVRRIPEIHAGYGMVVWNNRLWFAGLMSQGKTGIYVSDGYTVQLAFQVPGNVHVFDLCAHYGSLYMRGSINRYGSSRNERQAVYRYNGSSVVLLWEDDKSDIDFREHGGLVSWGRHLVWSKHGSDAMDRNPGVWMYDAEEDAIYRGPSIHMDASSTKVMVSALAVWNNTLAVSFTDVHTYTASTNDYPKWIASLDKTRRSRNLSLLPDGGGDVDFDPVKLEVLTNFSSRSFALPQTTKTQVILSSAYDAGIPGEKKVWVKGFVRCRIPIGCQIRISLIHDDNATEHPIQTLAYDAAKGAGWRDVQFSAVCATHSTHERSSKVRYKLYLENVALATRFYDSPEVDVIGLDFLPSPTRRSQYHIRTMAVDGQTLLSGVANTLSTRAALVAKLKTYWNNAVPLLFWEPQADGSVPTTTGKTVVMTDFLDQSFRLDTAGTEVASEVSFNLIEVA